MKIRKGFVSNSSSSSFIIATSKGKGDLKIKVTMEVDLEGMITDIITTEDQLKKYYSEEYGLPLEHESLIKDYNDCLKAIKEGKSIYILKVSNEGELGEAYIYENKLKDLPDGIEIIGDD